MTKVRSALTLLEMMLVLALLTVALAILYPATERLYRTHRIHQAGEQVRGKLAAARVRAIDEGLIYQFRYEPRGSRMLVMPHAQQPFVTNREGPVVPGDKGSPAPWRYAGELPPRVKFGPADGAGESISPRRMDGWDDLQAMASATWSKPVLFFPDGSASDAEFRLQDPDGREMLISVRGLTGAASVGRQ